MNKLNGSEIAGRSIVVKEAKPQENRSQRDDHRHRGGIDLSPEAG